jgi:hypothetical protein
LIEGLYRKPPFKSTKTGIQKSLSEFPQTLATAGFFGPKSKLGNFSGTPTEAKSEPNSFGGWVCASGGGGIRVFYQ